MMKMVMKAEVTIVLLQRSLRTLKLKELTGSMNLMKILQWERYKK